MYVSLSLGPYLSFDGNETVRKDLHMLYCSFEKDHLN